MSSIISKWITEGSEISDFVKYGNLIYRNKIVETFLNDSQKYFIIAGKGIGKTILLKYKRYLLEKKANGVRFLPADRPYIDFVNNLSKTLSAYEIEQFSNVSFCENFWRIAIQLCLLSSSSVSEKALNDLKEDINSTTSSSVGFEKHFEFLLRKQRGMESVCNYLISQIGESDLQKLFDVSFLITDLFRTCIHEPIVYFFDRFDQALKFSNAEIWLSMQQGLLEAAWNIMKGNPHVKIYLSLRQEAYDAHCSINKESMAANISLISYSENELRELMTQLVNFYENKKSLEDFLGINQFKNIVLHKSEPIYQLMNRYSIGRPRDFVVFCKALSEKIDGKFKDYDDRVETLKFAIITSSSSNIISSLHDEVSMLLTCLKTREEFDNFVKLFTRNILTYKELQKYCAEYNNLNCTKKCSSCTANSEISHPFCDLYIMGLLGKIEKRGEASKLRQVFKSPYEDITKAGRYGDSEYYLIHPALRYYIKSLKTGFEETYELYDCLLIGDNCPWTEIDSLIAKIHKEIDKIKKKEIKDSLIKLLIEFSNNDNEKSYSQLVFEYEKINGRMPQSEKSIIEQVLKLLSSDRNKKITIFVTYAYESEEHRERVICLTNDLRKMGFEAIMDESMKSNIKNIDAMMTEGLKSDKIIIVLSEKYKEKADNQKGGVWDEFKVITKDLEKNGNKYIFVSLDTVSTDNQFEKISPLLMGKRLIVDLEKDKNNKFNELISYITDENIYPFVEVCNNTRKVIKKRIGSFSGGK